MRIHRLEIQAFGPFAGREVVDFDLLGSQGLFLLNGSTGAGKTSVLDAIAYALYGQVPGARQGSVRRLRSHHAAPGLGPEVVCEFTAGGRRLEVTRSPEWLRPLKRGTGTTRENASTALRERVDGTWVVMSQRNDEAASEIQQLLGMNMAQFTKVVLLAQGEFAAFLRADAKDRQELLEKLFGTEVYKDLENQLAATAREAQAGVAAGVAELAGLEQLARSQAAGVLPPAVQPADAPADAPAAGAESPGPDSTGAGLFAWLEGELAATVAQSLADREQFRGLAEEGQRYLRSAQERRSRHEALAAALLERTRLAGLAPQAAAWDAQLGRHHKAEVLAGSVKSNDAAAQELVQAESDASASLADFSRDTLAARTASEVAGKQWLEAPGELLDIAVLESVDKVLNGQTATVAQALPQEHRLSAVESEQSRGQEQMAAARQDVASHQLAETTGQDQMAELKAKLGALRAEAVPVDQARQQLTEAAALLSNIEAHAAQEVVVHQLQAVDLAARENAVTARQGWLDAVERRLTLAAGELAAELVDGEPCMVCGSSVHPAPSLLAGSGADAVRAEKRAKDTLSSLEKDAADAGAELVRAQQGLAVLVERGGDGVPQDAAAALERATSAMAAATEAAGALKTWEADAEQLEQDMATSRALLLAARESVASLGAANAALAKESTQLSAGLEEARAGYGTLDLRRDAIATALASTSGALTAMRRRITAVAARDTAAAALQEAMAGSDDFATSTEVLDSLMGAPAVAATKAQLENHARAQTLLAAQLESADVRTAAEEAGQGLMAPDPGTLTDLEQTLKERTKALEEAVLRCSLAENALARVSATHAEHASAETAVAPLRERAARVAALADAARGGGENQLKMTLTSYVLAARLEQVAAAASVRLSTMSGDRYSLTHTDARAGGNKKSGLGLAVVDGWTQLSRDTATLSGGESFMASLSLALGLADVVQQESGGLDIETLFVDEGFGSLDEESLDQVMDALEGLRDGGRMVGLVSHVAEMKTRIPLHLHVLKGRTGSTLTVGESA
ncbi:AAA family ATPase [Arthrobacter sp. TMN-49]